MKRFTVGPTEYDKDLYKVYKYDLRKYDERNGHHIINYLNDSFKKNLNATNHTFLYLSMTGTSLMEVAIKNTFNKSDKLLVINGGDFGQRFINILEKLDYIFEEIKLEPFSQISKEVLDKYKDYDALICNMCETSTGILYDMDLLSEYVKKNDILFIVDAISSFMADYIDVDKYNIDEIFITSQKGLALSFGLSILGLSQRAIEKINQNDVKSFSFDLKLYLKSMENLETPFTPTVNVLLELYNKFKKINKKGINYYINNSFKKMSLFRNKLDSLNIEYLNHDSSNSITVFIFKDSIGLYNYLLDKNITICRPRSNYKDYLRVSSYGNNNEKDYLKLFRLVSKYEKNKI